MQGSRIENESFSPQISADVADQDKKVLTFGKLEPHPSLRSAASSNLRHFLRKVSNPKVPNREIRWQKMVTVANFFFSVSAGLVVFTAVDRKDRIGLAALNGSLVQNSQPTGIGDHECSATRHPRVDVVLFPSRLRDS